MRDKVSSVEELYASIAAHLRVQRHQLAEADEREAAILNIWHDGSAASRCRLCGAFIDGDEGGLYILADMRQMRECRDHYVSF
jgi:hypothetical protein